MRPAVLVLDMIVDFTTGRLGTEAARRIRPAIRRIVAEARRKRLPVIYCQDSHGPSDPELKVWGPHGMAGTGGAMTDSMLKPRPGEPVVPKHTFDGFTGTHLDSLLRERKVDTVILTGVCTDICVQHTAGEAFYRGYRVLVPRDAVAALSPEDHERGLRYMTRTYGTQVTDTPKIIQRMT